MSAPVTAVSAELALETSTTTFLPTPTAILDAMIMAVAAVDLLNGFGAPDRGDAFGSGRDKLHVVRLHLEAATPDWRDWDGAAAQAYAAANAQLQTAIDELEELDRRMQALVAEHGADVKEAHTVCLLTGSALKAAAYLATALYAIPVYGAEASLAFQIFTALGAAGVVLAFESMLISASIDRMSAANALAARYVAVGERAEPSGEVNIDIREEAQTRVDSFQVGTERVPMASGMSSVPTVAALAGDRTWAECRAAVREPTDYGLAEGTPLPDARRTPPPLAALAPFGQLVVRSAQAAQASGHTSQVIGQVQQIVSTAQHGNGDALPEAAADTGAVGRAPVAVAGAADDVPTATVRAPVSS